MKDFLHHLFIPRTSNNHRAKILHHTNLFLTIVFLFLTSFFIQGLKANFPSVLGIKADISSDQLLLLTNKERQDSGVSSLVLNDKLTEAAAKKAEDMFAYNYWAHNSPAGKTPWVFIKSAGYKYVYAGENLARGFSTPEDVVKAWMASPDHRSNMLSSNYQDVGFAVKVGKLNGEETVLIVEEFGNLNMPIARNARIQEVATASDVVKKEPIINSSSFSVNIYILITLVFILTFLLDMIIVEKKKVVRFVGHNLDHILYLLLILILVGILGKGVII
ncbi:MAG: CAP domain-containing protein [bacterium]|nr:CAP domain-containing protein [bacterium]